MGRRSLSTLHSLRALGITAAALCLLSARPHARAAPPTPQPGKWYVRGGAVDPVSSVLVSEDGRTAVVFGWRGAWVFDARRCTDVCALAGPPLELFEFSPDGGSVLGRDRAGRLARWSARTGEVEIRSPVFRAPIQEARYSPALRRYLLLRRDGTLVTAAALTTPEASHRVLLAEVDAFEIHPDGSRAAAVTRGGNVVLRDLRRGRVAWRRRAPERAGPFIPRLLFLERGRLLLVSDEVWGQVFLTRSGTPEAGTTARLRELPALDARANRAGTLLVGSSQWRAPEWRERRLGLPSGLPFALSADGRVLAGWRDSSGALEFYDAGTGAGLGATVTRRRPVMHVALGGRHAYLTAHRVTGASVSAHVWDLATGLPAAQGACSRRLDPERAPLSLGLLLLVPGSGSAAGLDLQGRLFWNEEATAPDGWEELPLPVPPPAPGEARSAVRDIAGYDSASGLVVQAVGGAILVVDPRRAGETRVLSEHPAEAPLGVLPDGTAVLLRRGAAGGDLLRLLALSGSGPERTMHLGGPIARAALAPDAALLVTADPGGAVRAWDLRRGTSRALRMPGKALAGLIASRDGKLAAGQYPGGRARVWDLEGDRAVGSPFECLAEEGALALGPAGVAAAVQRDGSVGWYRLAGGGLKRLGSLCLLDSGDWAFISSTGEYDSSRSGYLAELTWIPARGAAPGIGRLRKRYVRGLLGRLLGLRGPHRPLPGRPAAGLQEEGRPRPK